MLGSWAFQTPCPIEEAVDGQEMLSEISTEKPENVPRDHLLKKVNITLYLVKFYIS
jgi:hypothetical protein